MKRSIATVVMVFLLLLLNTLNVSCDRAKNGRNSQGSQKASLRIKWLVGSTYIGDIVAKEKGFWKDQGIDMEVHPGGFEFDPIKLVANGSNTFGITGADQLLMARAKGIPVVAIAAILQQSPVGWVAKKSTGIKTPYDFRGRKIGTQLGTNAETTLNALMGKLNIDMGSLNIIPIGYDLVPFLSGTVDVYPLFMNDETVAIKNKGIEFNIIDPNEYGVSLYGNVYFTTEKIIKENPELVKKFLKGMVNGWEWCITNPEEAVKIIATVDKKIDTRNELEVLRLTIPLLKPHGVKDWKIGMMDNKRWQDTRDIMKKYGGLKEDVSLEKAYDSSFINGVYGQ